MKKKNGFIAISIIYSFFLCFTMLMGGMLANYAHTKLIVNKINAPLTLNKEAIKPETYPEPEIPTKPNEPTIKNICDEEKAQNYLYCCILEDNDIQTD